MKFRVLLGKVEVRVGTRRSEKDLRFPRFTTGVGVLSVLIIILVSGVGRQSRFE